MASAPPEAANAATAAVTAASLSHRNQLGVLARADVEGLGRGVVGVFGLSYGLGDYVEVGASALIGHEKGIELGGTGLFLRGAWKPMVAVGVPDLSSMAGHGSVCVAAPGWSGIRSVVWVFSLRPRSHTSWHFRGFPKGYDHVVFVPAAGAQFRFF